MFSKSLRSNFSLKKTALHDYHINKLNCSKMIEFGGYSMPSFYKNGDFPTKQEYAACREYAAVFDISHMGQLKFRGKDRLEFLERVYTADFRKLLMGSSSLSLILNKEGGIIDDSIISNLGDHHHAVVNAMNTDSDLAHFNNILKEEFADKDVQIENLKDQALIALQGPKAMEILQKLVDIDLCHFKFMSTMTLPFKGLGFEATICRCGYTGEDGFEISVAPEHAIALVDKLLEDEKVSPAGLVTRDSLRLEAGLCLHGSDITQQITPIEAMLMWTVR